MSKFTTYAEHPVTGVEYEVVVEYNFTPPRAATLEEPAEGGVEIEDIHCMFPLSEQQHETVEQQCVDYAWERYYEGEPE